MEKPSVFVTYANDDCDMKEKVISLVSLLRERGIPAACDETMLDEGMSNFIQIMEKGLSYDKVIVVLSEEYKKRVKTNQGAVISEFNYIADNIRENPKKYILVSFSGTKNIESIRPNLFAGVFLNAETNSEPDTIIDSEEKKVLNTETSEYLVSKPVYNCQIMREGKWYTSNNVYWNDEVDTAADGNKYKNALPIYFQDYYYGKVTNYVVDYLLDKNYTKFSFSRGMLTSMTKSTTYSAVLRIYGYKETPTSQDETPLFQSDIITGGVLPFDGGEFDVSDVRLLRFELINENGGLGYYSSSDRGLEVILTDAILNK